MQGNSPQLKWAESLAKASSPQDLNGGNDQTGPTLKEGQYQPRSPERGGREGQGCERLASPPSPEETPCSQTLSPHPTPSGAQRGTLNPLPAVP